MRTKTIVILGLAAFLIAGASFIAGVMVERRFPGLFAFEPSPPAPLSPSLGAVLPNAKRSNGVSRFDWEFAWSEVPGAERYELLITTPSNRSLNFEVDQPRFSAAAHDSTRFSGDVLEGWSWKVRVQVNGRWSEWSKTRGFSVSPAGG